MSDYYVKGTTEAGEPVILPIEDDNVFTHCPDCGREHAVDLVEIASGGDFDLYGSAVYLSLIHIWYGAPSLYEVTLTLLLDEKPVDIKHFRLGIRTVELIRTSYTDGAPYPVAFQSFGDGTQKRNLPLLNHRR